MLKEWKRRSHDSAVVFLPHSLFRAVRNILPTTFPLVFSGLQYQSFVLKFVVQFSFVASGFHIHTTLPGFTPLALPNGWFGPSSVPCLVKAGNPAKENSVPFVRVNI